MISRFQFVISFQKLVLVFLVAGFGILTGPVLAEDDYLVSVGDLLQVDILDDSEEARQYSVGSDGLVQLPLIGGVSVVDKSLGQVRDTIHATYVSREIYVNPMIEVSVAAYRKIFISGDVKTPGFYDFHPFITAEQALGLAGGPIISINNEEARVLERRSLTGQLESNDADLASAAAELARFEALLTDADVVSWDALPANVQTLVDKDQFAQMAVSENQIIALERGNSEVQEKLLAESIKDAALEIELLIERGTQQEAALADSRTELERVNEMVEKGLQSRNALIQAQRQISNDSAQSLQIQQQLAAGERRVDDLKRELSRLTSDRSQRLLTEKQARLNEIDKLTSLRNSMTDRMDLLTQFTNNSTSSGSEARFKFQIRRRERGDGIATLEVEGIAELVPGDSLVVRVIPVETDENVGQ